MFGFRRRRWLLPRFPATSRGLSPWICVRDPVGVLMCGCFGGVETNHQLPRPAIRKRGQESLWQAVPVCAGHSRVSLKRRPEAVRLQCAGSSLGQVGGCRPAFVSRWRACVLRGWRKVLDCLSSHAAGWKGAPLSARTRSTRHCCATAQANVGQEPPVCSGAHHDMSSAVDPLLA
jgi:hypothetical protein